ncbi:MAG: ATP-binding protein [Pseudomonadota bacterium]
MLLAAFLLIGLLPATLVTGMAYYEARTALATEIQRGMTAQANATAAEIDRIMFERLQNIASWSKLEVMQDVRIGDIDKRLSTFLADLKGSYRDVYSDLYVIDNTGKIIASSTPGELSTQSIPSSPWLETSLSKKKIRVGQIANELMPISADITDEIQGTGTIGQLITVFNWRQMDTVLSNTVAGRSAAAIFDAEDNQLASTSRWLKMQKERKLSAIAPTSGYQSFKGFSWRVEIAQSHGQALRPARHMAYIFAALLAATVVLAGFIAVPIATSITGPLARLTEFANEFINAPSAILPPAEGPMEIVAMSHAFSKMLADLERLNENLTRTAKLAVVGEMAAAMSHEVRTPLGILRSSAQLLMREPGLTEEGREVCGFIISETDRLNKLVSTLIDSARPRLPEFSMVNVTELARQAIAMLRIRAETKNIALEFEGEGAYSARCDAEQITQVLLNLLLNAIQVLPEGGRVVVAIWPSPPHLIISIADNGPGIPANQRDQIFDPFFSQRPGGTGLGLAIVKQIMTAHHGRIDVYESSLQGAEFRLQLPMTGV